MPKSKKVEQKKEELQSQPLPSLEALKAHRKVISEEMVHLVMDNFALNRDGRLHTANLKLDSLNRAIWYLEN